MLHILLTLFFVNLDLGLKMSEFLCTEHQRVEELIVDQQRDCFVAL